VYWATGTDSDTMGRRDRVRQCIGLPALTVTLWPEGTRYGSVLGYRPGERRGGKEGQGTGRSRGSAYQ
jgi:hypothetical protein